MSKFERFLNVLLPVSDIIYAEYRPRKTNIESSRLSYDVGTFVHVKNGNVFSETIKVSDDDVLESLLDWLRDRPLTVEFSWGTTATVPAPIVVPGPSEDFDGGPKRVVCQHIDCGDFNDEYKC